MDTHDNARTTRHSRMLMVQRLAGGWPVAGVAQALGVTPRTVRKWRDRYAAEGEAGLTDRSSRPHHSPTRLSREQQDAIVALRRQHLTGPLIAQRLSHPVSTVGRVLRRHRLGRLSALMPKPQVIRYQRDEPGELIHIDIKKLGRIERIVTASTAIAAHAAAGLGGSSFMSPSMMPHGWPIPSCCPTNARRAPSASPLGRWNGSPGMGRRCSA